MLRMMANVQFETFADITTTNHMATYTKNYYDALVAKGFTKEEALKIVIGVGMPSIPGATAQ